MNILLVTMEMQVGGAETHIFELAKELKQRNMNVYVVSAGGNYAELLEHTGIEHIYAPLKNKKLINMVKSFQIIKRVVEEKKIDVIHAHARIPAFISSKVCKAKKIPLVTTAHGIYKVNFLLKILTNWGRKTLAVSEDIKKELINDYHLKDENIAVTVNGINTKTFCKEKSDKITDENHFNIIHVSRLDNESSNVAKLLINSLDDMQKEANNRIALTIVGDGNEFETIKLLAKDRKDVILTGLRTDVAELLKRADLFIGVSRAALEAMACELPVILAGNEAYGQGKIGIFTEEKLQEAIETNFCCRGCPEVTKESLEKDILEVYQMHEEKRKILGRYGRNVVEKYYSTKKMADDAEKMYKLSCKK